MRDFANQKNLLKESAASQRQRPTDKLQRDTTGAPRRYGRWVLLAVVVLVVVIVIVVKHTSAHHQQSSATAQNPANKEPTPATDAAEKAAATKPKEQGPSKPVFDFYTVLPQQKAQPQTTQQQDDQAQPADQTSKQFMLQVASYQSEQLAQQLRSQLILLGLKPTIASTSSGWYRIEVGPYDSMRAADKVRHQFQDNGINGAMVRQISDGAGG